MEQSVPKRRHLKFRRQGITQKKAYNIQNTAKVGNQKYIVVSENKLLLLQYRLNYTSLFRLFSMDVSAVSAWRSLESGECMWNYRCGDINVSYISRL
jgi:hypothetical protein